MSTVTPRPRIAIMDDPIELDHQRAAVSSMHEARKCLSETEGAIDRIGNADVATPMPPHVMDTAQNAVGLIRGSMASTSRTANDPPLLMLGQRSLCSAESNLWLLRLLDTYNDLEVLTPHEAKFREHLVAVCRRSALAAKRDAHRALAALAEAFPDAYRTDE